MGASLDGYLLFLYLESLIDQVLRTACVGRRLKAWTTCCALIAIGWDLWTLAFWEIKGFSHWTHKQVVVLAEGSAAKVLSFPASGSTPSFHPGGLDPVACHKLLSCG